MMANILVRIERVKEGLIIPDVKSDDVLLQMESMINLCVEDNGVQLLMDNAGNVPMSLKAT